MGDRVFLLGIGDVVEPAPGNQLVDDLEDKWQECLLSAPGLVGVKQWHIFEAEGLSINDRLPIVHPGDLVGASKVVSVLGSGSARVLLGESQSTLASTASLDRGSLHQGRQTSQGQKKGRLEHDE